MKKTPPSWILRLLRFFCKEEYLEQIEGDLLEIFHRENSVSKARRQFIWNSIRFFRWRYLKGIDDYQQLTTLAMIKNYLKVAVRTLLKQRAYAGINIMGLAIGLASCLLIIMYVFHERSYDSFYPDIERMYRVANGERGRWTPELLAKTMAENYPQVEASTKVSGLWESLFQIGDRRFLQESGSWADENVFKVFEMEFLAGNPETALKEPNNIVLTESLAKKCFPDQPAYEQTLLVDGDQMKVTGIVKDPPKNTHFPFTFIGASHISPNSKFNWTGNSHWTYAKLQEGVPPEEMDERLLDLYRTYVGRDIIEFSGHSTFEEFVADNPGRIYGFTLHPVRSIHLHNPNFSMGPKGSYRNVVIFSLIALFILVIACVNYINMSTARSAIRSKEVGIRKALGSDRKNIVSQFLTESMLITLVSVILALLLSGSSLTYFNELTGRLFSSSDLFAGPIILSTVGLLIIVGLLAGAYPAYVISGYSPLRALRGKVKQAGKRGLRSWLVAFQFAISIFLVATTLVIYFQVRYMQSQELGVNIDQTLVIANGRELDEKYTVFKNQLEQMNEVELVSKSSNLPFHGFGDWTYQLPDEDNRRTSPMNAFVSPGTEKILGLEMIEGRFFQENLATDTSKVVINEALAKELGWTDPIGKRLTRGVGLEFSVIGVMKDFNFTTLKREIGPIIFRYGNKSSEIGEWHQSYVLAKVKSQDILSTINKIEGRWNDLVPEYPFDAYFLNDSFQLHFEGERKFGQVFTTFSLLAILIAFLGIFALTTFVLQKRFKEIAVRKVLGATVPSLLKMIIKEFTRLVLIGGVVGIGAAFYWLNTWLEGYSYRIELTWYILAIPIASILLLTWMIVTIRSYKAAVANPSNALKEE